MGSKHPQDIIRRTGASQFDFIVACNYLIRSKIVKKPAEAIRYIEDNNLSVDDILEDLVKAYSSEKPIENDDPTDLELIVDPDLK